MKKLSLRPFFSSSEMNSVKESSSQDKNCLECGLFRNVKSPKMPVTGEGRLKILIIAEAPGKNEDDLGIQLIGDAGTFLREHLNHRGLDLDKDFWKTNACVCRPFTKKGGVEKNRAPKRKELKLCRQNYLDFIDKNKPKMIWLMGKSAIESYYMEKFSDEEGTDLTPSRWRALCIPDSYSNAWVVPLFHPSFAMKNEHDNLTFSQYNRDLDFAISCLDRQPPTFYNPYDKVKIIKDFDKVKLFLEDLIKVPADEFAFDYETTGIKPFNKGHKIACASLCDFEDGAYSFPLQHPCFTKNQQKILCDLWCQVLEGPSKKIAQNLKFEDVWSQRILGSPVSHWESCTMNASHILDNRGSFTGLKFQAFIRWGVDDYDKTTRQYLKSKKGSEFNKVFEAPLDDLLLYNGIDSLLTLKLHHEQMKEMIARQREANQFFKKGLIALADIQMNGICADRKYYEKMDKELEIILSDLQNELLKSDEAKKFKEINGVEISLTSDFDLRALFFDILKLESPKETEGGLKSVDAEVLNSLDSDFARKMVAYSKLDKVKGTYIGQFLREIDDDGKIRPYFDLHKADTFRSASSRPNFQNQPTRDDEAKKYARSGVFPSPGNCILGFDYKALEVSIAACISKDPVLMEYCSDLTKDMHRDQAVALCRLSKDRVSEKIRFYAKNGFVFPEIYGSYFKSCAKSLWETYHKEHIETTDEVWIIDHLEDEKIIKNETDYNGFEKHVKDVETEFWQRFKKLKQWQEKYWKLYEETGVIDLPTGFSCKGYMSRNKVVNTPIQGSAFHCLLYSLIHIHKKLLARDMKTKIIGQIHDNLVFDCDPSEKEEVMQFATDIATVQIRKEWKWIIVPLVVSWEGTEIDQAWYHQKKIKVAK